MSYHLETLTIPAGRAGAVIRPAARKRSGAPRNVRIGLLGLGTVGLGLFELVSRERTRIRNMYGIDLQFSGFLVRDPVKERPGVPRSMVTTSAPDVLDGDSDIIVELVGGVHSAGAYLRRAMENGRHVVTANKALLADSGAELFADAARAGVRVGFEASVCAAVPIVRILRTSLAAESVESISGVLNGTCNYIICRMEEGLSFDDALQLAQRHGFAEADPALDVDGEDAMQKLSILAGITFGSGETVSRSVEGIRSLTNQDLMDARGRRCVIRQVAEAKRVAGGVALSVRSREIPLTHPLAKVVDENNGVVIRGGAVGELSFFGKGAGALPTASAVLSDVLEIASGAC